MNEWMKWNKIEKKKLDLNNISNGNTIFFFLLQFKFIIISSISLSLSLSACVQNILHANNNNNKKVNEWMIWIFIEHFSLSLSVCVSVLKLTCGLWNFFSVSSFCLFMACYDYDCKIKPTTKKKKTGKPQNITLMKRK